MRRVAAMLALIAIASTATAQRPHRSRKRKPATTAPATTAPTSLPPWMSTPAPTTAAPLPPPGPAATATPAPMPPVPPSPPTPVRASPPLTLTPPHSLPSGETRCALCHTTTSWDDVRFAHDRTGFPLHGAHAKVTCRSCHPGGFAKPVPDRCAGCHRDVHAGEFGLHCEGCHDESSWRTNFTADAHRRTNFPLTGRHAMLPCVECHPNARDRSFARGALECAACHLADYQATAMSSLDHAAVGFPTSCQQCHLPWRWSPATFPQHDRCFTISHGPHSGIRCLACHASVTGLQLNGQCAANNVSCTTCHVHECARTDAIHARVPGYQCKDRKCYECHRF